MLMLQRNFNLRKKPVDSITKVRDHSQETRKIGKSLKVKNEN